MLGAGRLRQNMLINALLKFDLSSHRESPSEKLIYGDITFFSPWLLFRRGHLVISDNFVFRSADGSG